MRARKGSRRYGRASLAAAVIITVLLLVLAGAHLSGVGVSGRGQNSGDLDYPDVEPSETDEVQAGTPATAVFEANVPFDLKGVPMPDSGPFGDKGYFDGGSYLFDASWGWNGTMRVTVGSPVLYESLEEAGYEGENLSDDSVFDGCKVVAVDIKVENIDAMCKEEVLDGLGVPAFNTWMFHLESSATGYGNYADATLLSAPAVEGINYDPYKARSYTWVNPGESITIRMGYHVTHEERRDDVSESLVMVDDTGKDLDYTLVLDAGGWREGAPEVILGKAVPQENGSSS